jgi:Holliday junction resolvasome RuvABC endonuclease subunit
VSLNHAALILLRDGELRDLFYTTNIKGSADKSKKRSLFIPVEQMTTKFGKDKHRILAWRLKFVADALWEKIVQWAPDYVGVEDYALRAEQGSHQLGEIGGVMRWMLFSAGIPFRLWDPTTVKMFVAHDGTCQKDEVARSVQERWDKDFTSFDSGGGKAGPNRQTSEDLADAYGLAQMVWIEAQIRAGKLRLDTLHPKEIQVFNRITKYQPVPAISREWISG